MQLTERLSQDAIADAFATVRFRYPATIAVAVSGGSDSMALLHLAHEHFSPRGKSILALTVDHALRPESGAEAERVAEWCKALGVQHRVLKWDHPQNIGGNLSDAARQARYRLLKDHCLPWSYAVCHDLLTGHTLDDQAETVLMRLARGSGVDGLSAIRPKTVLGCTRYANKRLTLHRPLLGFTRDQLRGHLRAIGQDWIDDPTNDDDSYYRIKARKMFATLEPLGLTKGRLATTARVMGMARDALEVQAGRPEDAWDWSPLGFAETDWADFQRVPREIRLRRLADAMNRLTGKTYRPRLAAIESTLDALSFGARTLHGCIIRQARGKVIVMREPNAISEPPRWYDSALPWDNRFDFDMEPDPDPEMMIAMLGEAGLRQIPKNNKGLSREWRKAYAAVKQSTPALWRGDVLLSAPLAPWVRDASVPHFTAKAVWPE